MEGTIFLKMIQYLTSPEKYQNSHGKENEMFGALACTYFSIWNCFLFDLQSGVGREWPPGGKAPSTCSRSGGPARLRQGGSCPRFQRPARAHGSLRLPREAHAILMLQETMPMTSEGGWPCARSGRLRGAGSSLGLPAQLCGCTDGWG